MQGRASTTPPVIRSQGKSRASAQTRVLDARPDTLDFRDRMFEPTLIEVQTERPLDEPVREGTAIHRWHDVPKSSYRLRIFDRATGLQLFEHSPLHVRGSGVVREPRLWPLELDRHVLRVGLSVRDEQGARIARGRLQFLSLDRHRSAEFEQSEASFALPADAIITPHPGEAARLLGTTTADVQRDRFGAARALSERYACVVVLKGAGSIVAAAHETPRVIAAGNPGMAVGGMGDVLSGVIAALRAQGMSAFDAASCGALLHAAAGDAAAHDGGERGLLPSDLMPWLRHFANPEAMR